MKKKRKNVAKLRRLELKSSPTINLFVHNKSRRDKRWKSNKSLKDREMRKERNSRKKLESRESKRMPRDKEKLKLLERKESRMLSLLVAKSPQES